MKITLLYQVSRYIRVKNPKKYKELGPAKLPCYKRVLLYPTSFITRFHCNLFVILFVDLIYFVNFSSSFINHLHMYICDLDLYETC